MLVAQIEQVGDLGVARAALAGGRGHHVTAGWLGAHDLSDLEELGGVRDARPTKLADGHTHDRSRSRGVETDRGPHARFPGPPLGRARLNSMRRAVPVPQRAADRGSGSGSHVL